MRTRTHSGLVMSGVLIGCLMAAEGTRLVAQEGESRAPNRSGRWQLNHELSESAEAKLERIQSAQGGGHGPGRHGGGGFGADQSAQMEEARGLLLNAAPWFVLTQDGERIVRTDSDGRVRTLTANGRKEKVNGQDVRTKWDKQRLVSEISIGGAKVTETYERVTNAPRLIVTTKMDMRGHEVSVRRVYDTGNAR